MKRLIIVSARFEPELRAIIRGASLAAGRDLYAYIKGQLSNRGIPHRDEHMHPAHVPSGHVYYHS